MVLVLLFVAVLLELEELLLDPPVAVTFTVWLWLTQTFWLPTFCKINPAGHWLVFGMGVAVGLGIGVAVVGVGLGVAVTVAVGVGVGVAKTLLDKNVLNNT